SKVMHRNADALLQLLDTSLTQLMPCPWLEALRAFIFGTAELEATPLTLGEVACLTIAFPATLVSKVILGRPPFPQTAEWSDLDALPPAQLAWGFQVVVAVGQLAFTFVDVYMDNHWDVGALNLFFGIIDLIVFGVMGAPSFYGVEPGTRDQFIKKPVEFWWWVEWGIKAIVYIFDAVCAV